MVESGDSLETVVFWLSQQRQGKKAVHAPLGGIKKFPVTMSPGIKAKRISDRPNADPTVLVGAP